jgi:hypothetical protein
VWLTYTDFFRHGARLDAAAKAELSSLNQQLATLATTFSQNLLRDENDGAVFLDDAADLAGLSAGLREAAAAARVHEEVADMQAIADAEGAGITIAPWDYRFYAEKVRRASRHSSAGTRCRAARSGRRLPGVPRPRCQHRGPDTETRLLRLSGGGGQPFPALGVDCVKSMYRPEWADFAKNRHPRHPAPDATISPTVNRTRMAPGKIE